MTLLGDITDYIGVAKPPTDRYEELFITPALPYHFSREPVSMSRMKYKGKKQIFTVYCDKLIEKALANGRKYDLIDQDGEVFKEGVYLKRFKYSALRTNVRYKQRRWRTKNGVRVKYWYFTKFDEDTSVRFFFGDIDDHGDQDQFKAQVKKTIAMLDALDLKPIWFTSPGDMFPQGAAGNEGEHRQGLYFLVLLDQPMKVRDLRVTLDSTFAKHGLEGLEHCFMSKRRNVRLLGQEFVYPVDVQPDGTVTPVDPGLPPKEQFLLTVDLIEDQPLSSLSALVKSAQDAPGDAQIESGGIKKRKGGLRSFRRGDASESIVSDCTFTRMTKNRICPKAIDTFPHDLQKQQSYAEDYLVSISPACSKTCSNPTALSSLIGRSLDWYRSRHKPLASSETGKKRKEKESNDRARFQAHRHRVHDLIYVAKIRAKQQGVSLSQDEIRMLTRFFQLKRTYNGRVAVKYIYASKLGFTNQRRWSSLIRKLMLLEVLDEYDRSQHRCRQWGLDQETLDLLSTLHSPHKGQATTKIVVAIHPDNTPPSPPFSRPQTPVKTTPEKHPWHYPTPRLTKEKLKLLEDPVFPWETAA